MAFDYFACSGGGHGAKHFSESSSDGFEVRGASRKLLHAHGQSPSAPNAAIGAGDSPTAQPNHHPASVGTNGPRAADPKPATTGLHIPTLQAIHRMQQQASPTPTMMPTMPQTPTAQPPAALPRDPAEYTQANFPTLTPRQLAVLAQLEMQDQQALRSSAHNILQPGHQDRGTCTKYRHATHSPPAPHHVFLGTGREAQLRLRSEPHTAPRRERQTRCVPSKDRTRPQHQRHRRSRSHRQDRRSCSHRARRTHRHRARTPRSRSPSRPSRDQAFILRSRSQLGKLPVPDLQLDEEWMTKWSYRAPPPQHTGPREGFSQSSQPQMETRAPSTSFMDLTQEATTAAHHGSDHPTTRWTSATPPIPHHHR